MEALFFFSFSGGLRKLQLDILYMTRFNDLCS